MALIAISPSLMGAKALFPLENPGILSIPLGFLGAWIGTLAGGKRVGEDRFTELLVRANTGLGAEPAGPH